MSRKGLHGHTMTCPSIKHVRCLLVLSFTVPHRRHTRDGRTWEKLLFVFLEGSLQGLGHFQTSCDIYPADISAKKATVSEIPVDGLPWESHHVPTVEAFSFTPILISRSLRALYCSCPVRLYDIFRLKWLAKLGEWEGGSVTAARGTSCIFNSSEECLPMAGRMIYHLHLYFLPYFTPPQDTVSCRKEKTGS